MANAGKKLQIFDKSDAEIYYTRAIAYVTQGKYHHALGFLNRAVAAASKQALPNRMLNGNSL